MTYKRGKTYWYEFVWSGRRIRESAKTGNPKVARQVESARKTELAKGEVGIKDKAPAPKFTDYAENWLATYAAAHCKYSTQRSYKLVFEKHLKSAFSGKFLDEITRQDITDLINKKLASPSARGGTTARGTVRNILAPLREMLNHAVDSGLLQANPANRAGRYMKEKKMAGSNRMKIDPLTRDEAQALLLAAEKCGQGALILTALRTGLRMGELFALQWGDLDFNGRFIEVRRSIVRGRLDTPKSGQLRRVDMSLQLSTALQEARKQRKILFFNVRAQAERLRSEGMDDEKIPTELSKRFLQPTEFVNFILRTTGEDLPAWVFVNEEGQPLDQHNFRRRVYVGLLTKAGLRQIRFHDLRHTFASLLLQQGESLTYVKEQMGHHSIQVTVDIYGHLIPGSNKQAVDRLDDTSAAATA